MNNISNINTNKFESFTGVLNTAPVKLSGLYKLFIDLDKNIYLDDYNDRRIILDLNQPFIPQVSNFLKTKTEFNSFNKLKYGAFRNNKILSYHIPLYINNTESLPDYFVITKTINDTINNSDELYKSSNILDIIDLDKIGIKKIFSDITNKINYDYLFNFNWENSNIKINGYSIDSETNVEKTISIVENQANQTYLHVLNNKILNTFSSSNIIFPKFINIEFEFKYTDNITPFNNFFGFLSKKKIINLEDYSYDNLNVSLLEYTNKIEFKQEVTKEDILPINFIDIISINSVVKPEIKLPQIRFRLNNISVGDYIKINHPDNTVYFEYEIIPSDIKDTLRESLKFICNKLTNLSGRNLIFTSDVLTNIIKIVCTTEDSLINEYYFETTNNFLIVDSDKFVNITESDLLVISNNDELFYDIILMNNFFYEIEKTFLFDDKLIVRLKNFNNNIINGINFIETYITKTSVLLELKPINYYGFNSNLYGDRQYDKEKYIENLIQKFGENTAIEKFGNKNNFIDKLPYITDIISENNINTIEYNTIESDLSVNDSIVLNMLFNTPGSTAFLTPNIFNIDKRFYKTSGNLDYNLLTNDELRFHYFLIKSEKPSYIDDNDIKSLRYFTEEPKITSRLILNSDDSQYCETIFLGVKYRLPQKYKNFNFAVYLDFNDTDNYELTYKFEINNFKKTIYLKINKFLDFVDLLRGGDSNNDSLIDLSFFYTVYNPHNENSNSLNSFKSGGLLMCDDKIPVLFQNELINDWKYYDSVNDKWYICLKRSLSVITQSLKELFTNENEQYIYVYSKVNYNGVDYNYISMTFKITGLIILEDNYLWCEDVSVKFFDTKEFFINVYNESLINEIFKITEENVISHIPLTDNFYSNQNTISTLIVDGNYKQFNLINPDYEFSLKENYFEFGKRNIYDSESNLSNETYYFKFPDFKEPTWDFDDFLNNFDYESLDDITYDSKITLFNRNQIWSLIKNILKTDVKFKHSTPEQTYNLINELLLSRLVDYTDLNSLEILNAENNNDRYIKLSVISNDENIGIWKLNESNKLIPKIIKLSRYHSNYLPYFKLLDNELEFQKDVSINRKDVLFNIYDKNFYGNNITATGLWKEVTGNIVSSLYCKYEQLSFTLIYPSNNDLRIDMIKNLSKIIDTSECIITNKNESYISQINNNIDEYISETYIKWLLMYVYKLESVTNELGQKLNFTIDLYEVILNPKSNYTSRFENVIFNFTRK